jgi:hypothetical protein
MWGRRAGRRREGILVLGRFGFGNAKEIVIERGATYDRHRRMGRVKKKW